jgi:hypothetical protein
MFKPMFLVVWKYAQMHQNTFFTTPYIKNFFLKNLILVVWKYAQMHKNTFLPLYTLHYIHF